MRRIVKKIFKSANDRLIRAIEPQIKLINSFEPELAKLSDNELKAKTQYFKKELENGKTLDDLHAETFAVVRETAKRTLGQRHYDVQLIGGTILHQGKITEMKTGEGKTLVSTLAAYLNALEGKGVHIVTVNDYLASRDSKWMGEIFRFLGLTVGCITNSMEDEERKEAYAADITYGTNNEFGFDYLRDNMKFEIDQMVQRPFNFAIIDEVDSILIDEARTPLIISGPVEDNSDLYTRLDFFIPKLNEDDYEVDEKARSVTFTEDGTVNLEKMLLEAGILKGNGNLYDLENISIVHHVNQALRAHKLFEKEKDYIVKDNQVIIIDEFTGRMMEGRRFSEGLHQALEAKEKVKIQNENQTLASVTFQNYFRLYPRLSGMTGTAMTEAKEFLDIYSLEVVDVPTNVEIKRIDDDDDIYRTKEEKFDAIIELTKESVAKNQPILIGTASIEQSEHVSKLLKKAKIKHNVLNARQHHDEAYIIAQAGKPGTVTVATNMAGRGTDIQLGGNAEMLIWEETARIKDKRVREEVTKKIEAEIRKDKEIVIAAGGLCVIGTERHESRRIDNQLRGRAGRQGDPGYSKFFLSAEDDLIRIFGADKKMNWVLGTMGEPGVPIAHPLITSMMGKSQEKVEARNYEIRKTLLKFDNVMNEQRKVIYEHRIELMKATDCSESLAEMREDVMNNLLEKTIPEKSYHEQWNLSLLEQEIFRIFGINIPISEWAEEEGVGEHELSQKFYDAIDSFYNSKKEFYGEDLFNDIGRKMLLFTLDELWKDHLLTLDNLKQGINLRGYAQKDPLNEYKFEAFAAFTSMLERLKEVTVQRVSHVEVASDGAELSLFDRRSLPELTETHEKLSPPQTTEKINQATQVQIRNEPTKPFNPKDPETWGKIGRNEKCPCGSDKKYKQCHGIIK